MPGNHRNHMNFSKKSCIDARCHELAGGNKIVSGVAGGLA